jgi:hypothetical protein
MQKLLIEPAQRTPGIMFSPDENVFYIRGTSSPEDVRKLYYPVIEWMNKFVEEILKGELKTFNTENPLRFQIDLSYFNSSSAKFLFDLLSELKKLPPAGIPINVEWHYDEDDKDMKEAGVDFSQLVGVEFTFIPKPS